MSEVQRFRKKPVVVEARQLVGTTSDIHEVYLWVESHVGPYETNSPDKEVPIKGISIDAETGFIVIATLEGEMTAKIGDWIIKGVAGEFYPCKPEIFEATYEPADQGGAG